MEDFEMLQFAPTTKIFVAHAPVNFRKGFDGHIGLIKGTLMRDPLDGSIFIFRNNRGTMVRLLFYDGQGFYLCTKRLSSGRFSWWPSTDQPKIDSRQLSVLLWSGNPDKAAFGNFWKKFS
jgi:transposase